MAGPTPANGITSMRERTLTGKADPEAPLPRLVPAQIVRSVEASLVRLQTSHLDLIQLHWPDRYTPLWGNLVYRHGLEGKHSQQERPADDADVPFDDVVAAIGKLIAEGKARARVWRWLQRRHARARRRRVVSPWLMARACAARFPLPPRCAPGACPTRPRTACASGWRRPSARACRRPAPSRSATLAPPSSHTPHPALSPGASLPPDLAPLPPPPTHPHPHSPIPCGLFVPARFIGNTFSQNDFSLLDRRFEGELAEACSARHHDVGLIAYGCLCGGTLSGKYNDRPGAAAAAAAEGEDGYAGGATPGGGAATAGRALLSRSKSRHTLFPKFQARYHCPAALAATARYEAVAAAAGLSTAELALAWAYSRRFMAAVIVGATTLDQLRQNCAAASVVLSPETLRALDEVHAELRNPTQRD